MTRRPRLIRLAPLAVAVTLLAGAPAPAQVTDYFYNPPNGAGPTGGPWDTSTPNWSTTATGPVNYTWTNSGSERANFGNTAGTVTLGTGISTAGLVFTTAGYTITGNTLTLSVANAPINTGANNETISSILADGGNGFAKTGTGALTLTNTSNTFTGPVSITGGGAINIPSTLAFGPTAATGTVTLDGGTLRETNPGNAGSFISANRPLVIGSNGGTVDYSPSGTDFSFTTIYTPNTAISGAGNTLTKTGPGEFRYNGAARQNTSFGKLVVNQGLFRLGDSGTGNNFEQGFGAVPAAFTPDAITLNGGQIGTSFGVTLASTRGITLGPNGGTFNTSAAPMTVPGAITGPGGLKGSTGTLTLQSAASDYAGPTTIGSVTTAAPSGTLSVAALANGGAPSAIGASSNAAGNLILNGGNLTYTGPAVSTDRLFSVTSLGGTITANGTGPITFTNTGANLSTDKGVTNFTVNSGSTFAVLAAGGTPADLTGITVGMGVSGAGIPAGTTVTGVAATLTEFTLSTAATSTNANTPLTFTSLNRTLTLTGTNTGANTIAGTLANSPTTTLAVTKAGAGTWVLAGANTYTGPTAVNAGTLLINNSTAGSAVTVAAATASGGAFGTLGGSGTVGGAVTVQAGTGGGSNAVIAPGAATGVSIGTLSVGGGLTLPGTYTADVQTGPDASDLVAVTGNLNLTGGTLNLPVTNTYSGSTPYTLLTYTGALTSTFAAVTNLPATYTVSYATPGQVNLVPVPEPAFVLLACGAAAGLAVRRRRARARAAS